MNWTPELVLDGLNPPVLMLKDEHYNYVVNNGKWYEAPKNVTLDMVRSQWKKWTPTGFEATKPTVKTYQVLSSNGKTYYTVTVSNGIKTCDCPAGMYRGKCKHINSIQ